MRKWVNSLHIGARKVDKFDFIENDAMMAMEKDTFF